MKKTIPGVFDDDLETFLINIEEYNNVIDGKVKCKKCNTPITLNNISYIYPESGSIKFICSNPECIQEYLDKGDL